MSTPVTDTGPFAIVPEWLLDTDASDRAVRLYALLGRYADREGSSFPSRKSLAARLKCSVDSLDRARQELEETQALVVERRFTENGDPTTNRYTIRRVLPRGSRTVAETGTRTGAAQNENQSKREVTPNGVTPASRKANPLWNALTEVFGDATTETARSRRGKVCRSLAAAGASPDEIVRRAKSWPRHFDDATLTELALEKHWDVLARKPLRLEGSRS